VDRQAACTPCGLLQCAGGDPQAA